MKLGVIGLNEGNGHPFSYSAMFNGYDPKELIDRCPFALIKEYLPREHRNEVFIDNANVTHVWTQNKKLSEDVAKVSLIPNIVSHYEDMIGQVDGVILARDDPWNHWEMAKPFIKRGIPIFIDKQLTSTVHDFEALTAAAGDGYPIMACSPMRYTRDVVGLQKQKPISKTLSIHGVSRVSWIRYGHHLLEGVTPIWGYNVKSVQSLCAKPDHDIVQIIYEDGLNIIFEFMENVALPIQYTCFQEGEEPFSIRFQDFFHGFRAMMMDFTRVVETGEQAIPFEEIKDIAKIVLAGCLSKESNGISISPRTLEPLDRS